jgi:hypothetical protein
MDAYVILWTLSSFTSLPTQAELIQFLLSQGTEMQAMLPREYSHTEEEDEFSEEISGKTCLYIVTEFLNNIFTLEIAQSTFSTL